MELVRFNPEIAEALPGGANAQFMPMRHGERMTAMLIDLGKKGDTGKRELPNDILLTVITGEGKVRSGGGIIELKPGDIVLLPGGIQHHIWTVDTEMRIILLTLG